jgi:FtsP/CotA-like multicopper oxidase with cupredoxin domain
MDTINHVVALNAVEKWTIKNNRTFGHVFHIHV